MKLKLICCEVLLREACMSIARSPHTVDPEFTIKGAHEISSYLKELLQKKIDETEEKDEYDAILLGYGLCGNATLGLEARSIPLVIPRAHDCCTLFLGSRKRFIENFKDNLSGEWTSTGYMERGDSYLRETDTGRQLGIDKTYENFVTQYGEENAQFLWETLHPLSHSSKLIYIEMPETAHLGYLDKFKKLVAEQGKEVCVLEGSMRMIDGLIQGEWNEEDFLVVPPGAKIQGVYDQIQVMTI